MGNASKGDNNMINIIFLVLRNVVGYIAYLFSFFFPKSKKIWVFGSWFGERYADNPKYMYEWIIKNDSSIKAVWISKEKSIVYELRSYFEHVYYAYSIKGIWYCIRAGYAFYNCGARDISEFFVARTTKIMFWHGIPLKRILYDDDLKYPKNKLGKFLIARDRIARFLLLERKQNWDFYISSSPLVKKRLSSAFLTPQEKILEFGYPRQDVLLSNAVVGKSNKINILYAPTHRSEGKSQFSALDFFSEFDFLANDKLFGEHGIIFHINLHYYHDLTPLIGVLKECKNIKLLGCKDIYEFLGSVDILITDYSSIYIDYLVLEREILFYAFDLEEYLKYDRGMYEDYLESVPGPVSKTWEDLLERIFNRDVSYQERVISDRRKYFNNTAVGAMERLHRFLTEK